ncbi:ATP phosphoribosyltransferase [Thermoproteus tenax Kra 1]|uniref:ATP phosphoribosyltransferase n=2 Tax=Thermoproteus tenax TaxID=2271 RepID=G4RPD9_THETK|nr:ATP phosphoribosyltransferase [Thermoproteus tenax Kra 1]
MEPTIRLLELAGISLLASDERSIILPTSWPDLNIVRLRPEDIPAIVAAGKVAAGITGHDFVVESGADVVEALDLKIGRGSIVVAAVKGRWRSVDEIPDGTKVATKYVNIASRFFDERGKKVKIVKVSGSVEVMPLLGVADVIVDVMATGTTLALHGLEPLEKILDSSARLIVEREQIDNYIVQKLLTYIKGYLEAEDKRMIFLNVPAGRIADVVSVLPAMESPSVARLVRGDMYEVFSVVDEDQLPDLIMKLKAAGAKDVVVVPLNKLIR